MFETITAVPEAIKTFYEVETRQTQQFEEDGITPKLKAEEYQGTDEDGNKIPCTRMVPVFLSVDYVQSVSMGERKNFKDVWRIIDLHKGTRDNLIRKFVGMVCNNEQWKFHDKYLKWYQDGLELDAIVLPDAIEGEPDPQVELQERIAAHNAKEPVKPALIDIEKWIINNYSPLREAAFPSSQRQNEMRFNDAIHGTKTWIDAINAVRAQYPSPQDLAQAA